MGIHVFTAVYPRARGGATLDQVEASLRDGLSPRTRGSPVVGVPRAVRRGSIPAHAGEPRCRRSPSPTAWVYPRARGGAGRVLARGAPVKGLSPRTRGSLEAGGELLELARSIPAHAGEPNPPYRPSVFVKVYPRARGGAWLRWRASCRAPGLSPRTRGSLARGPVRALRDGSIPAHAGEPLASVAGSAEMTVYPRARGGARRGWRFGSHSSGLSPRTRGSLTRRSWFATQRRSIPAHAGEPLVEGERIDYIFKVKYPHKVSLRWGSSQKGRSSSPHCGTVKSLGCSGSPDRVLTSSTPSASAICLGGVPR